MATNKIKCKFCEWEVAAFFTNKNGKIKNGYDSLTKHMIYRHPEEYEKILLQLGDADDMELKLRECGDNQRFNRLLGNS